MNAPVKKVSVKINQDVALLEKWMKNAPPGNPSDEEMAEIVKTQHRLRKERKRRARYS
jgi:hypothetical protein